MYVQDVFASGTDTPAITTEWALAELINQPSTLGKDRLVEESNVTNLPYLQAIIKGHFRLLPFGSGRRGCPGTLIALLVIQASLAAMIQSFEWKVGSEGNGSVDMEEGTGLTLPILWFDFQLLGSIHFHN
ncbi:hypothetical protein RJ639_015282 [Escallonia herrerae]|uniref:Cytochrome P450 n=1 Tax=Escallonia herrerae TaxID=1293975 RepID=A0AA89AMX7_9ASTE|nr:hypothetical protein RJ639_015282 [Escallonia herrerae]